LGHGDWIMIDDEGQVLPDPGQALAGGAVTTVGGTPVAGAAVLAPVSSATSGFVINISWDSSANSAPAAFKSVITSAVQYLESQFTNAVSLNINIGYGEVGGQALGYGALGMSMNFLNTFSYSQIRAALASHATTTTDAAAMAALGTASPTGGTMWLTSANAKVLGLGGNATDAYVGFSASNTFDYNEADGITAGSYDFYATVVHELTEVMGRIMLTGGVVGGSANSYAALDMFHYSAPGVIDHSASQTGYFSIDGGKTSLGAFNTVAGGDAADWASSMGNDACDAFSGSGVVNSVSTADLIALDTLGWNRVQSVVPSMSIALVSDTGASASDGITSQDALTGVTAAYAVVALTDGGKALGTVTANASGTWSFTPASLAQGAHSVTASSVILGSTVSSTLAFTYDTIAPVPSVALTVDTGTSATDKVTANTSLGGTAEAGGVVTISDGATVLGTATANAAGAWSFAPTGLAAGAHTITAATTDLAGNTGKATLTFTYMAAAPALTAGLQKDTGTSASDGVTSLATLQGTSAAGVTIRLSEAGKLLASGTAASTGAWVVTPAGLTQGAHAITVAASDLAGNTTTTTVSFTYDTLAPVLSMALVEDTGSSAVDHVTASDALHGTAEANALVTLTEGTATLGTVRADGTGAWSFTPSGLAAGVHTVTAAETDLAGNIGKIALTFTYMTGAPGVTVGLLTDSGSSASDLVTSVSTLKGTTRAGAVVSLSEAGKALGAVVASTTGTWALVPAGLANGAHTILATATDLAGNSSTATISYTLDTVAPHVTVALVNDNGTSAVDHVTSDDRLAGTAEAGATVTIADGKTVLGSAMADSAGAWAFTPTGLAAGVHTIIATSADLAGNVGTGTLAFTYVLPVPTAQSASTVLTPLTAAMADLPADLLAAVAPAALAQDLLVGTGMAGMAGGAGGKLAGLGTGADFATGSGLQNLLLVAGVPGMTDSLMPSGHG